MSQDEAFKAWWYSEGSQPPYTHHDCEEHTMRMCEIAWANGAYKAIAELESQEPVAWMHTKIDGVAVTHRPADLDKHPERWEALYKTPPPCPTCEALARTVMLDQTSHDTHPPQRTEPIQSLQCFHCQDTIETLNDKVMHLLAQRTEQNFCPRCGKRTKDLTHIHTCTPPQD
jgi:hypothetical protein